MAKDYAGEFQGERVVDGDASTLTALKLYEIGTDTVIDLNARYHLVVTDVLIMIESAGDVALVAGTDNGSKQIVNGYVADSTVLNLHFKTPYVCAPDDALKFKGASFNRSTCIVRGRIITR